MKRFVLVILAATLCLKCLAGGITAGPWVSEARENCVTILWTSDKPGTAYVELEDGTKVWETYAGRRIFKRLHSIKIDGLKAGQILRYRPCGIEIADDSNARDPKFGDTYEGPWHNVRTFNKKASSCHFSVFNDIHMRTAKYSALAGQIDSAGTDFLFLNGDIVTAGNYKLDTLVKYALSPLGNLKAGLPVLFARGNHEGRGNNVNLVADVFPNASPAPFYYTFRHGPVAFIVFDAGETGKNRSVRYSGKEVYEDYLFSQIEWAKKAMKEPDFRKAPVKVCLIHVPMIDHPDQTDYLTQRWLNKHIVPLLNKAGITLMIGADLHEFMMCEAGSMGNSFPIIVNDDARRLDFSCDGKKITIRTYNSDGDLEFQREF
ncbi:MAG: metallophosphoesterase [Bacteroidales bacterium]|nr:metallophosphoesterase [Bacteroidales bacterium]